MYGHGNDGRTKSTISDRTSPSNQISSFLAWNRIRKMLLSSSDLCSVFRGLMTRRRGLFYCSPCILSFCYSIVLHFGLHQLLWHLL